jgi:hypothetical protein
MKYRENFRIYLEIQREFLSGNCQYCSNAVHYQLPLGGHFVFIDRGPSGYEKLFQGFFSVKKEMLNTGLSEHGNKKSCHKYVRNVIRKSCVLSTAHLVLLRKRQPTMAGHLF